jgi:hypothetical protein
MRAHPADWDTADVAERKTRIPIPGDLAADVLFRSDRTCCVCHKSGKQVQIHHINDDPGDNAPSNLAILCLECHAQTQISGGFGRRLNAKVIILYRDHWLNVVQMRRAAETLQSELAREDTERRAATSPAVAATPEPSGEIGQTYRHLGIVITLIDVAASPSIRLSERSRRSGSGYEEYEEVIAGSGAKFVTVKTRVMNDAQASIDLTCGYPIKNHLIDDHGRRFDAISKLYRIRGNPACNDNLQPGFASDMTWIYRVPLDAVISAFEFEDLTDFTRVKDTRATAIPLVVPNPTTPSAS